MIARARCLRVVIALCGIPVLAAGHDAARASGPPASVTGYAAWAEDVLAAPPEGVQYVPALEERLAALLLERRSAEAGGEAAGLEPDPALKDAARAHAVDMLVRDYVGHIDPDGRSVRDRVGILDRRFVGLAGENLAELTGRTWEQLEGQLGPVALSLADGFMASPEHRENLLKPDYTHHGLGAAVAGERLVVVHVFAARLARLREPLPLRVAQGEELPLAFEQGDGLSVPAQYGYARPDGGDQEIVPLGLDQNEVSVEPGTWRLVFLIPSEEEERLYKVVDGPLLVVE